MTAVTGRLYADDDIFDRLRGVADSGYATSPYIGPLSGLAFNSGYSTAAGGQLRRRPGHGRRLEAALLAARLRACAIQHGVALGNADERAAKTIAVVHSPTISALVNTTDVNSDNFFAEMLLKLLGAEFGGGGTTAAGATVVEQFAASQGHRRSTPSTAPA